MTRPFHIQLSPIRSDMTLSLVRDAESLLVNGMRIDCSPLAEGDRLPSHDLGCEMLVSDIVAEAGSLRMTVLLPHGPLAQSETLFPAPLVLTEDGPVTLPLS